MRKTTVTSGGGTDGNPRSDSWSVTRRSNSTIQLCVPTSSLPSPAIKLSIWSLPIPLQKAGCLRHQFILLPVRRSRNRLSFNRVASALMRTARRRRSLYGLLGTSPTMILTGMPPLLSDAAARSGIRN